MARANNPVSLTPINGKDYLWNDTFGEVLPATATEESNDVGDGNFIIYDGTGGTDSNDGFQPNTTYYFKVFEYNGSGNATFYLTGSDDDGDPVLEDSQATLDYPTTQASFKATPFSDIEGAQMTVSWNAGTGGSGRILIAKEGGPVDAEPQDFTNYSQSINFGNGLKWWMLTW